MTFIEKILWRITGRLPQRIIDEDGKPYLERYYVGTLFDHRFYLHRFVASDPDRGLHDHPWKRAYSLILSGYYVELTRIGSHEVFWFNSLTHDKFHRVLLPKTEIFSKAVPAPCWTLFFHTTNQVNKWGFLKSIPDVDDADNDDAKLFVPHKYLKEGPQKDWWLKKNLRPSHVGYYDHLPDVEIKD